MENGLPRDHPYEEVFSRCPFLSLCLYLSLCRCLSPESASTLLQNLKKKKNEGGEGEKEGREEKRGRDFIKEWKREGRKKRRRDVVGEADQVI